jgi:hypothetical protein
MASGQCIVGTTLWLTMIGTYIACFFVACIALSESSAELVVPVCGDGVRTVVLLHVIYAWIGWVPGVLFELFRKGDEDMRFWLTGVVVVCSVSALSTGSAMSFAVAHHALADGNCTAALSEGSRYNAPVLAHLCYAYFVIDLVGLITMCLLVVQNCEFMCTEEHSVNNPCYVLAPLLWGLLILGLVVNLFVNIVALDLSSGPLVAAACGTGLWDTVLRQLILFHLGPLLVWGMVVLMSESLCRLFKSDAYEDALRMFCGVFIALGVLAYFVTGAFYSFTYARDARDNANCTAALSAVNSMGTPMLEHVGFSHLGIHILFVVSLIVWGSCCWCGACSD